MPHHFQIFICNKKIESRFFIQFAMFCFVLVYHIKPQQKTPKSVVAMWWNLKKFNMFEYKHKLLND